MELTIKVAQLILSLSILVVLHELGHFIPAKLFKTRVEKFFLFFDVKFALFKKKIGETTYGIGWLPLGGYVKIAGMIDESMDKEQLAKPAEPWEFRSKPAWQRLIIMIGGVVVNLLLAFAIYSMVLMVWGKNEIRPNDIPNGYAYSKTLQKYGFQNGDIPLKINSEDISDTYSLSRHLLLREVKNVTIKRQNGEIVTIDIPENIGKEIFASGEIKNLITPRFSPIIAEIAPNSPAFNAGIQKDDRFLAINGQKISFFDEVSSILNNLKGNETISVDILRGNEEKNFQITLQDKKIGFSPKITGIKSTKVTYGFFESIPNGIANGYWILRDYIAQFKFVFTKKGASELGGIGSMTKMFAPAWDWQQFWSSTAMLSVILAFMNILPIPALDGGHTVFLLYEMITRRKPSEKVLEYAQIIGIVILLGLMIFANGNDIYKAFFNK